MKSIRQLYSRILPRRVYFIVTKEPLSQEVYDRLKKSIDDAWPDGVTRPVLLEGVEVIRL